MRICSKCKKMVLDSLKACPKCGESVGYRDEEWKNDKNILAEVIKVNVNMENPTLEELRIAYILNDIIEKEIGQERAKEALNDEWWWVEFGCFIRWGVGPDLCVNMILKPLAERIDDMEKNLNTLAEVNREYLNAVGAVNKLAKEMQGQLGIGKSEYSMSKKIVVMKIRF